MSTGKSQAPLILVVEDDLLIAMDLVDELEVAGINVAGPARTVQDALRMVEAQPIDAALLDVHLHDEVSYPVADALLKRGVPFVFLSGHAATALPAQFRECLILQKPVMPVALASTIESLLQG